MPSISSDKVSDVADVDLPTLGRTDSALPGGEAVSAFKTTKYTILLLTCLSSVGYRFADNGISPLKSTFIRILGITNAQYGSIAAASSLVNTFLPFFLGFAIDISGPEWALLCSTSIIFIGTSLTALSSNTGSFVFIIAGRIIVGLGVSSLRISSAKIYGHWFRDGGLALAFAIDLASGDLAELLAKLTSIPMRDMSSFWGWALWIPAMLCGLGVVASIACVWLAVYWAPASVRTPRRKRKAQETFLAMFRDMAQLPCGVWLFICARLLQNGVTQTFTTLTPDIISVTRGSSAEVAGYLSAIASAIPIVLGPFMGFFMDRVGYRSFIISFGAVIKIVSFVLLGYTHCHAAIPMIIISLSTFDAIAVVTTIPILIPLSTQLGLAIGCKSSLYRSGVIIASIATGRIQDITPGKGYNIVIAFLVAVKAWEFLEGLIYRYMDKRFMGGLLDMKESKRVALNTEEILEFPGSKAKKPFVIVGMTVMIACGIIAWVLYILYTL